MMVNTSVLILLYTIKSVANHTYFCTYSKWSVIGEGGHYAIHFADRSTVVPVN